jgi:hypothetical protein
MIKPYMQDMHTLYMHQHVSTRMTETRARWNKDESSPRKNGSGNGISQHFGCDR